MNDSDVSLLKSTLNFTADGTIPSVEEKDKIVAQLSHLQERFDLAQVGLANFHMRRIVDLVDKLVGVENSLFDKKGELEKELPYDLRIKVWQELSKQMHMSSSFIDDKATTPTVSSPERLERIANKPEDADEEVRDLPPDSRRRVLGLLHRLKTLPST